MAVATEPSRQFWYFAAMEPSRVNGSVACELFRGRKIPVPY